MTGKHIGHGDCCHAPAGQASRRGFLTLGVLAAGVTLLAPALAKRASAGGGTDILLLSCMDYRLTEEIDIYMKSRGLMDEYDHIILAGASLGALTKAQPAWGQTFWEHVDVAKKLHHIKKIMVMDHRDCGAYKVFLNFDAAGDLKKETDAHAQQLRALHAELRVRHPDLEVELLLMALDGKVEVIPAA